MNSQFGKIAGAQWKKGLYLFIIPLITIIISWLQEGSIPTDWETWKTALITCFVPVLYWILSLLQNSDGEILKKEQPPTDANPVQ